MTRLADIFKVVAIVVSMALGSCVKNSNIDGLGPQAINYHAVCGLTTEGRAAISGTDYPTGVPFAAFAVRHAEGETWAGNSATASYLIKGDAVAYNSYVPGAWATEIPYYWPIKGGMSFFAYSPWADANGNKINNIAFTPTTGELKVTGWNTNDAKYKGVDLMFADPKYDQTEALAASGVPTVFRHKLSLVSFKAGLIGEYKEGGVTYEIQLRKVTLKNVKTQGNYSSINDSGRWTSVSGSADIVLYNNPSGEALSHLTTLSLGDDQLVIPQGHENNASGVTVEIQYFDTKTSSVKTLSIILRNKIPTSNWVIGSQYTYYIMFNVGDPDYIEFDAPTISAAWADGGTYELVVE